jgi:hypothetical protein
MTDPRLVPCKECHDASHPYFTRVLDRANSYLSLPVMQEVVKTLIIRCLVASGCQLDEVNDSDLITAARLAWRNNHCIVSIGETEASHFAEYAVREQRVIVNIAWYLTIRANKNTDIWNDHSALLVIKLIREWGHGLTEAIMQFVGRIQERQQTEVRNPACEITPIKLGTTITTAPRSLKRNVGHLLEEALIGVQGSRCQLICGKRWLRQVQILQATVDAHDNVTYEVLNHRFHLLAVKIWPATVAMPELKDFAIDASSLTQQAELTARKRKLSTMSSSTPHFQSGGHDGEDTLDETSRESYDNSEMDDEDSVYSDNDVEAPGALLQFYQEVRPGRKT